MSTFTNPIDTSVLDGTNGFSLVGSTEGLFGQSVSYAGDLNGDGIADIVIGNGWAGSSGQLYGSVYVIFGRSTAFPATIDITLLNGTDGFRLDGLLANDYLGSTVSSAGDVNGDGIDDLIIRNRPFDSGGFGDGTAYIVFGTTAGFSPTFDLNSLNGSNGF